MSVYREVESCCFKDLFSWSKKTSRNGDLKFNLDNFEFAGSGKAAISLILRYLNKSKIIPDKTYEVMVPEWIGSWVYAQITNNAFPTKHLSNKTKALFVYHQYGFPQNLQRLREYADKYNLQIIEDCAHTIAGKDRSGTQLGSFGEYSLYSFSKFFFCFALGGVRSENQEFLDFVRQEKNNTSWWLPYFNNLSKYIGEYSTDHLGEGIKNLSRQFIIMSYGLYNESYKPTSQSVNIALQKIEKEIETREKYYAWFRDKIDKHGICDHLESKDVYPYVIPVKVKNKHKEKLIANLQSAGFATGAYNFDMNRFYIEPKFEPCIWIFCHSGLQNTAIEQQLDIVLSVIS
jgi:dTDP-4-amino-4,6-dideoxygalactose transaminase